MGGENENPFELYRNSRDSMERLDKEKDSLVRLGGSRKAKHAVPGSLKWREELLSELEEVGEAMKVMVYEVESRTRDDQPQGRKAPRPSSRPAPPEAALLSRTVSVVSEVFGSRAEREVDLLRQALSQANESSSVPRAVDALDELKSSAGGLPEAVEAVRKELRTFLGLSPLAPVSLREALSESGFIAATDREDYLIEAVDDGVLAGAGGRGQSYDDTLEAISDCVSSHEGLSQS